PTGESPAIQRQLEVAASRCAAVRQLERRGHPVRKTLRAIQIRSDKLRRPIGIVIVVVGIVGLSLQATASTRLDHSGPAARATSSKSEPVNSALRVVNPRLRFAAAVKTVICHSTSSDTNPYNRIDSA